MENTGYKKAVVKSPVLFVIGAAVLLLGMACRFNIREIGFAEIAPNPYILYYFHEGQDQKADEFQRVAGKSFQYSNVKTKAVSVLNNEDPVLNYLKAHGQRRFPVAVLLSPDGTTKEFKVPKQQKDVNVMLRNMVGSSFRSNIKSMLVHKYAVVLLLSGKDKRENQLAAEYAQKDIVELESIMPRMPKLIDEGPELVTLSRTEMEQEQILLWSLGIDASEVEQPTAVIIYGRGRIMGDVIPFKDIQSNSIFKLLNIIGADCECGLDRKWMLGKLIPMTWDPHLRTELFGLLKFDVENPMILSEMSQIISIESSKSGGNTEDLELFQPKEYSLEGDISESAIPEVVHLNARQTTAQEEPMGYDDKLMASGLYAVIGIVLLVLIGVIILVIKNRGEK